MQAFKSKLRHWVHHRALARQAPVRLPWDHWGYTATADGLQLHGVPMADLVAQFGSPLHVLNVPRLLQHLQAFATGSDGLKPTLCCSVKSYPVPGLLALLLANGSQAEVISEHELWLMRQLGVPAAHIIFNGPAKSDAALEWSIANGIKAIHLNHREEMDRVSAMAQRLGRPVRVGLRLAASSTGQFGFAAADPATLDALTQAIADPWLQPVSLHGHRGGLMRTAEEVATHVGLLLDFMRRAREAVGWTCALLDVGGSLAVPTQVPLSARARRMAWTFGVPPDAPALADTLSPGQYSAAVCRQVAEFCSRHALTRPEVVMEPGRALAGDAQALLSTVLELRDAQPFSYAVTDVGTAVAPSACDEYHQMGLAGRAPGRPAPSDDPRVYRLVGPICHLGDVASLAWQLPPLQRGDVLAMMDSGAYFVSDASSFSFPQPGVVAVFADGRVQALRRTETSADMVHRDLLPTPA